MKNIQRIILSKYYLAVLLLASTAYLQAQRTPYTRGNLSITQDADIPSNVSEITRITGALVISGTITTFPNFAALEVVELKLGINGITTPSLTTLTDIFPALDSVRGDLEIQNNTVVRTITGFAELDSVGGNLSIGSNDALMSLPSFSALTSIGGSLEIGRRMTFSTLGLMNPLLTTVSGFGALKTVGEDIHISRNAKLTTVSGFDALKTVGQTLHISGNAKLTTISGFDVVESVGLSIEDNPLLTTLPSFSAFKRGGLAIRNNAKLTTISGFDVLESGSLSLSGNALLATIPTFNALINGGFISIIHNTNLTTISGFDALESLTGSLSIGAETFYPGNPALTTVSGFAALKSIAGDFIIENNAKLKTVSGFDALTSIGGHLEIGESPSRSMVNPSFRDGNPALTSIPSFSALTTIGGWLSIDNNPVLTALPSFSAIKNVDALLISNNVALTTISGFDALASIDTESSSSRFNRGLIISGNAMLTSISGFNMLTIINGGFSVRDNAALTSCCGLLRFVDGTISRGTTNFARNGAVGCNSVEEIKIDCPFVRTLLSFPSILELRSFVVSRTSDIPTLEVFANVDWQITQVATDTWITSITPNSGTDSQTITIEYEENTLSTSRDAILTLAATDAGATETVTITLTQEAAPRQFYINISRSIDLTADANSVVFDLTASVPWAITKRDTDTWITSISPEMGSGDQRITIQYDENTTSASRDAILTLAATDEGATETVTMTLTQAEARILSADNTDISLTVDAGDANFNVTTNVPWEITKRDTDTWITNITPDTGSDNKEITITYEENTTFTSRDAILTLSATDGGSKTVRITLTQAPVRQLSADETSIPVNAAAGRATFNVTANVPWGITKRDTDDLDY